MTKRVIDMASSLRLQKIGLSSSKLLHSKRNLHPTRSRRPLSLRTQRSCKRNQQCKRVQMRGKEKTEELPSGEECLFLSSGIQVQMLFDGVGRLEKRENWRWVDDLYNFWNELLIPFSRSESIRASQIDGVLQHGSPSSKAKQKTRQRRLARKWREPKCSISNTEIRLIFRLHLISRSI